MTPTDWTPEDPEGAGFVPDVCSLLANYAAAIMPEGSVECPGAGVDVELLLAVVAFERDSSARNSLRLHTAFLAVMDGWLEAALRHGFRPMGA